MAELLRKFLEGDLKWKKNGGEERVMEAERRRLRRITWDVAVYRGDWNGKGKWLWDMAIGFVGKDYETGMQLDLQELESRKMPTKRKSHVTEGDSWHPSVAGAVIGYAAGGGIFGAVVGGVVMGGRSGGVERQVEEESYCRYLWQDVDGKEIYMFRGGDNRYEPNDYYFWCVEEDIRKAGELQMRVVVDEVGRLKRSNRFYKF